MAATDLRPEPAPPAHRGAPLLRLVIALLVLLLVATVGLVALWHSPAGLQALLRQVPGLELQGVAGRPTGGRFSAERLVWRSAGLTVTVEGLAWGDAHWRWRPYPGAWVGLALDGLRARAVQVRNDGEGATPPAADRTPSAPPASLRLPIELVANGSSIGTLQVDRIPALRALRADIHLGDQRGSVHRVGTLQASWPPYALAGDLAVGTQGEMPVSATLGVANPPGTPNSWRAGLRAEGALQRLALAARLYGDGDAARDGPLLQADARVTPWAGFPLAALTVRADGLDLRRLAPSLPPTELSGSATLAAPAPGQPPAFALALRNGSAGAWNAGRLPLRTLQGTLRLQARSPLRATLEGLAAELGGERPAGRVQGRAGWNDGALDAQLQLDAVLPAQLDTRAPAMRLSGPVELALQGAGGATPPSGHVKAHLEGRLEGRSTAAALRAEARFETDAAGALRANVPQLEVRAGEARAQAQGRLQRGAGGDWQVEGSGRLARFDPGTWWPALAGRRGSSLNGHWRSRLAWPHDAAQRGLNALDGEADLVLEDSRFAGVPVSGRAELQADAGAALQWDAQWQAGSNRVALEGRAPRDGQPASGSFDIDAPALGALAPWHTLGILPQALRAWLPQRGALTAQGRLGGRWPALRTEGRLQARALQADAFGLDRADTRWSFGGLAADAPLSLQVDAAGLSAGKRRLDRLQLQLDGTPGAHTLTLSASSPVQPPAWTEAVGAASSGRAAGAAARADPRAGTRAELALRGGWQPLAQGGRWRGTLQRLVAAPRDAPARPWLSAHDIEATLQLDAQARLQAATLAPGAIAAFGGGLRWQQASWQAGRDGGAARFALDAQLQPLRIAPLLAQLQPGFDWRGELALGGPIRVRSAPALDAEVVLERSGDGDLSLAVDGVRRSLGLSDLRVALTVHGGRWQLTQAVAGRALGVLGGYQVVQASPQALWPSADAPVQGSVELRVAELSSLSPWLPAGWRIGGDLHLSAALGGRLGDPALEGEMVGNALSVRNLLVGVNLHDGALRVRLSPQQATIEQLVFRGGGEGSLVVRGAVRFRDSPQAQMQVVAEQFRVLDRFDRQVTVSGRADIHARDQRLAVTGRFGVDDGLIDFSQEDAPTLDEDVVVIERRGAPPDAEADGATTGALGALDLDLVLDLGPSLRLQGRGLQTRLAGQLHFTSPQDSLVATGVVRTVEGTYTAYGQNLVIDRGVLTFTGELANPQLDVVALRPDIDVRVGVIVSGRAVDPRIRLFSDPEMAEMDQLTWLLLGRAPEGLGRQDTVLLQRAAMALLAGERGGSGNGLVQRLGLDELSVARADSGRAEDTVLGIGKQLSKRLFLGYERALSAAGGTWQLIYRIAGRLTLRLQAGAEESVDAIWTWRW